MSTDGSSWSGAGAASLAEQFEQERCAHRTGIGGLLAPSDLVPAPSSLSPPPQMAGSGSSGSNLGAWLATLGAGEFESAFRDQQFETVEELVEAR